MSDTLRTSVILLAYNQAPALRRALAALESSASRESFEILVVDCASTDGAREVDAEFPGIHMLRLPHHLGAGRALNIAVRTAKAETLLFLSPNVEVQPETVGTLADALEAAGPEVVAVCPAVEGATHLYRLPSPSNVALIPAAPGDDVEFASLDALTVRKGFVMAMNYFDQRYGHYWVDAELAMQIRKAGKKVRLAPEVRVQYHPAADPLDGDPVAAVDKILGAAEYAGKYGGSGSRYGAALGALARFDFQRFGALVSGQKLDGSQAR